MNRKMKWGVIGVGALLLIGGGLFAFKDKLGAKAEAKPEGPPMMQFTPNEVATVQTRSMPVELQASGVLAAERSATVRAKTSAVITALSVREGDAVKAGQVIAKLDTLEVQQKVAAQEGALAAAKARLVGAKKSLDQQQSLFNQQFIAQSALVSAQSAHDAAVGDANAAQAQVSLAKQGYNDAVLRSPITGVVAKRFVQPGEKVSFDAPIVQVVDLSTLEMQSWVAPEALSLLKPGSKVNVQVSGLANSSKPIVASVKSILPVADAATRQVGVVVSIPNASLQLKAGLQANAMIVLESRTGLTVPSTAIADNAGVTSVWVAKPKDAASATAASATTASSAVGERVVSRIPVSVDLRDDTAGVAQILRTQVKEGDVVLAGRYDGLKDGQVVKLIAAAEPAKAGASAAPPSAATAATAASK